MSIRKKFPRFYTISCGPHTNTKQGCTVFIKNKKDYEHTSYPKHLKLTDKNKVDAYIEKLIPHSHCVMFQLVLSVFEHTYNACAPIIIEQPFWSCAVHSHVFKQILL